MPALRAPARLLAAVVLVGAGGCSDSGDDGLLPPVPSDSGADARASEAGADARIAPDSGSDAVVPAPDSGICAETGEDCASTPCCGDRICVDDGLTGLIVCAAPCTSGAECVSGCCIPLGNSTSSACGPPIHCEPPPTTLPGTCPDLVLVANDGTYLGDATSNEYATDGVCNEFSSYGSPYSSTSIFNEYGTYGSEYSFDSAYNPYTSTPPVLYCITTGEEWNPVTKNDLLAGAIDPDLLCLTLQANGY